MGLKNAPGVRTASISWKVLKGKVKLGLDVLGVDLLAWAPSTADSTVPVTVSMLWDVDCDCCSSCSACSVVPARAGLGVGVKGDMRFGLLNKFQLTSVQDTGPYTHTHTHTYACMPNTRAHT